MADYQVSMTNIIMDDRIGQFLKSELDNIFCFLHIFSNALLIPLNSHKYLKLITLKKLIFLIDFK